MTNIDRVFFPSFLSVVVVNTSGGSSLRASLTEITKLLSGICKDFEVIVIDNASQDESINLLKQLTSADGLPNLQVYALTKTVDDDTAAWVGLEHALGDFVVAMDPSVDDLDFLPTMLEQASGGADVVFARNTQRSAATWGYRVLYNLFNRTYRWLSGIDFANDAPQFRVLSRSVINFLLRHPMPAINYRHLPATGGFAKVYLDYAARKRTVARKSIWEAIDRGSRLLVSSTQAPMRIVMALTLFGAAANLIYSLYVIGVALFKVNPAPGWVTLSLQQSGMFFLISLVLLVLGEYVLHMARLSSEGPAYHIAHELTSAVMTRHHHLNVEQAESKVHRSSEATRRAVRHLP